MISLLYNESLHPLLKVAANSRGYLVKQTPNKQLQIIAEFEPTESKTVLDAVIRFMADTSGVSCCAMYGETGEDYLLMVTFNTPTDEQCAAISFLFGEINQYDVHGQLIKE